MLEPLLAPVLLHGTARVAAIILMIVIAVALAGTVMLHWPSIKAAFIAQRDNNNRVLNEKIVGTKEKLKAVATPTTPGAARRNDKDAKSNDKGPTTAKLQHRNKDIERELLVGGVQLIVIAVVGYLVLTITYMMGS